jgi:histidine triad (HIT) family protein
MTCLFCQIIDKSIPAEIVKETDNLVAFKDIAPQAPHHLLIIPRQHIATLNDADPSHQLVLGEMMLTATELAKQCSIAQSGYRVVMNTNADGGQAVYHIHLHVLGGRSLLWPPG